MYVCVCVFQVCQIPIFPLEIRVGFGSFPNFMRFYVLMAFCGVGLYVFDCNEMNRTAHKHTLCSPRITPQFYHFNEVKIQFNFHFWRWPLAPRTSLSNILIIVLIIIITFGFFFVFLLLKACKCGIANCRWHLFYEIHKIR